MHPVQIHYRRKARAKMARSRHSFSSRVQPTQAQIDPSWIAEKGWVVRREQPSSLSAGLLNGPLPSQPPFLAHIIYTTERFKELSSTACTNYTKSIHSHTKTFLFTILIGQVSGMVKGKVDFVSINQMPTNTNDVY